MKRFFKSVRRFWKGQSRRMRTVYLMVLTLLLLSLAFGIYMLARNTEEPSTGGTSLLFDSVERGQIQEIVLHHAGGKEFNVERYSYELPLEDGSKVTLSGFRLMQGKKSYANLTLDDEPFAELVVGAGMHFVLEAVISAPEAGDENYDTLLSRYYEKLAEYGFGEKSPYYELKTVDGKIHRVLYGSKTATGGTYYVRLEGDDTVYVSSGTFLGDLLYADAPTVLVKASFIEPLTNDYAYAYVKRFTLTDFIRYGAGFSPAEEGLTVSGGDRVGYTALDSKGNRVSMITLYPLDSTLTDKEYKDAFLGKPLGEQSFSFDAVVGTEKDENGNTVNVTQTVNVVSIDFVDRGNELLSASFVNASYRDLFHRYSIYEFLSPSLKNYLPDSEAFISALESISKLSGTVVSLDFNADTIKKYNLYSHMIELDVPLFGENIYAKDEEGNDTEDLAPAGYTSDMLYVSAVTERGTRYVGSILYGIVAEVDASALAFLDDPLVNWIEPSLLNAEYSDITELSFDWHYSGENKWLSSAYKFNFYYKDVEEKDGTVITVIDRIIATGEGETKTVDEAIFNELFYRILYTRYAGEHNLSEDELSALLADEENVALSLSITLSDGKTHVYRFLPVSADRVLVALDSESDGENAAFVIYGTVFKSIARAYVSTMEGVSFDHADRY